MIKIFVFICFNILLMCHNVNAERIIRSGAILYDTDRKERLMTLNGDLEVHAGRLTAGYYTVLFWIKCGSADLKDESIIKRGRKIYDTLGHMVGYTNIDIATKRRLIAKDDSFYIEMIGCIGQYSIKKNSVLETDLDRVFATNKKELIFDDFDSHFKQFIYSDGKGSGNFTSKIYMDGGVETLSPGYRLILVFLKQDLAAIIYTREIVVPYYESQASSMPYKIYYMKKMTDKEKIDIAGLYLK